MASDKVNYPEVGGIAQAIKYQIRTGGFWDGLTGSSKESLDQIATAIARTVSGDGVHWDAIIGFAHAAKPGTEKAEPDIAGTFPYPATPRATAAGVEAIERSMRSIPARNDHG